MASQADQRCRCPALSLRALVSIASNTKRDACLHEAIASICSSGGLFATTLAE